jgi:hypothetical protein
MGLAAVSLLSYQIATLLFLNIFRRITPFPAMRVFKQKTD